MNLRQKINFVKSTLFEMYPDALTELEYETEFQLLIAIIMSAQTTDKQVNKVNKIFFQFLKTPQDGVNLGEEFIRQKIRSVSFFNNKARYIFTTSKILVEKYHSNIPHNLTELTELPGVGIKTAKVFLAVTENAPYLPVDTHVHRVLNRLGLVHTKSPLQTDKAAEKIFTQDDNALLHHTLIFFGRYQCTAKRPKCKACRLRSVCDYIKEKEKSASLQQ